MAQLKLKIFESDNVKNLEEDVNNWLEQHKTIHLIKNHLIKTDNPKTGAKDYTFYLIYALRWVRR